MRAEARRREKRRVGKRRESLRELLGALEYSGCNGDADMAETLILREKDGDGDGDEERDLIMRV